MGGGVKSDNRVKPNQVKVRLWLSCGSVGVLTMIQMAQMAQWLSNIVHDYMSHIVDSDRVQSVNGVTLTKLIKKWTIFLNFILLSKNYVLTLKLNKI